MINIQKIFSSFLLLSAFFALSQADDDQLKPQQRILYEFQQPDFVFPLLEKEPASVGKGGKIYTANLEQWRTLGAQRDQQSTSLTLFKIDACGMMPLHYHPRASGISYLAKGNNVLVGFIEEDYNRMVLNIMNEGDATLFEEGLIHFIANEGCEVVEMIFGYGNKDPGFVTVAQATFKFPDEIIAGSFGMTEEYVERIKKSGIPFSLVQGSEECLRRCKKYKKYDDYKPKREEYEENRSY
jgi:oxalate decarboxylase/phosphoglucose isomerase-like protein (cupin superfamily)